ncbi:suppressor APC domain-containing protein 1 [Chanodichthys erythropterus]|uniref:suppressor APC domain-containing protein 1 n=1 Tax=Chanodichthys erythropterus TaxID=933992 RepID=UPI00351EC2F6
MACDDSYTVLITPLQNSLYSPDALHCFHWLKRRRDLERQKDVLWAGLQVVEQAQLWYQNRQQLNLQRHISFGTGDLDGEGRWSCALRSCMQRVNGSLGSLMSDSCMWYNLALEESGGSDWDLRWSNATLVKEVNRRNQQISRLELEKAQLLQQLVSYHTSDPHKHPHIYTKKVSIKSNSEL